MKLLKPTMGDVARRAGVSASTVARVLYNKGYVGSETRKAVEGAVRYTGYRPNVAARSLRMNRSFSIGLVVCGARLCYIPPAVVYVVQSHALDHGYAVLTFNSEGNSKREGTGVDRFLDHHVDAVIFFGPADPANVRAVTDRGIPAIQLERIIAASGPAIEVDPLEGMRQAINHLHSLGHRHFAYMGNTVGLDGGMDNESVEALRERTFLQALSEKGISIAPECIKKAPYGSATGKQPGHKMTVELLDLAHRPTAVVCGSDVLAASALQAINEAGLSVPADLSIVGFDDSIADLLTPALSTIAQPVEELGQLAVEMAIAALEAPQTPPRHVWLKTEFVQRNSTGPASRAVS